jgi:mono/diheme cytochrome c family protein
MNKIAQTILLTVALLAAAASRAEPFVSYGCYQCHGYSGHGASSGPRLSAAMPYEGFQQIVRFPYGGMPAYPRELLSDEDLRAIYAFIRSQPPAPAIADLPLLYDTSKGKSR